ncbi:MAG: sensor histidine kinase [Pseudomonadota bacterium]
MLPRQSLRLRLLFLILAPLTLVSIGAVSWRYLEARDTAQDIFDRNLLITAFAVARSVTLSGGDSLAPATQDLLKDASGGDVFYHVYGPDGSFVTGYSRPPVAGVLAPDAPVQQYDARHQGKPVRVARLLQQAEIDGIGGTSVITVWQRLDQRDAFIRQSALQAGATVLLLLTTVAGLVLVGVGLGLRPLNELEDAIQKRSSADLSPITRHVPQETRGIVRRLNSLFAQVTGAQEAQQRFVSLAAHQLRNPIAAIHTLAKATQTARTLPDTRARAATLLDETRAAMRLTEQLLSLERVSGAEPDFAIFDLSDLLRGLAQQAAPRAIDAGLSFDLDVPDDGISMQGDAVMLREAVANLLDNALAHGGPDMTRLSLTAVRQQGHAVISVTNDGNPLPLARAVQLFERFAQGSASKGAGLGLSIASQVAKRHGGTLRVVSEDPVTFEMRVALTA